MYILQSFTYTILEEYHLLFHRNISSIRYSLQILPTNITRPFPRVFFQETHLTGTLRSRINHTNSPRTLKVTRPTEIFFHEGNFDIV